MEGRESKSKGLAGAWECCVGRVGVRRKERHEEGLRWMGGRMGGGRMFIRVDRMVNKLLLE